MRFCSIATAATLPHARVLAHALAEHHPGAPLTVLVLPLKGGKEEPFEQIELDDLEPPAAAELLRRERRWRELAEFIKPWLLRHLLAADGATAVFLDAEVDVCAPLETVTAALQRSAAMVCPRTSGDLPEDGSRPTRDELVAAGLVSPSLTAVSSHSSEFFDWWCKRLDLAVGVGFPAGSIPDPLHAATQFVRPLDLAPSAVSGVKLVSDPGCAVSYWNLHERRLGGEPDVITVDGAPLRFLHFEGFDPERSFWLSEGGDRVRVPDSPLLAHLCHSYAERLRQAGWSDPRRRADVGRPLPNGMTFDNRVSFLHADAIAEGAEVGDVFTDEGMASFMDWLRGPAPHGAAHGINRYAYRIYQERDDLPRAFPDLDGRDGPGFADWTVVFGVPEAGLPSDLLPAGASVRSPASRPAELELSVNAVGFFGHALGLGEAARGYAEALRSADIDVSTTSVEIVLPEHVDRPGTTDSYGRVEYEALGHTEDASFNLVFVNPDELPLIAKDLPDGFFERRRSIGIWGWEVDYVPERWGDAYSFLDEVWVYSAFMAQNIGRAAPIPAVAIPPPVIPPDPQGVELDFELPAGFRFLFAFDFYSTIQRKNPIGLVRAFKQAFASGEGPQLVVKTINGPYRTAALDALRFETVDRPDIHVIDRSLSPRERDALLAACDCYVSLHRSEGFGLSIAEAMALGKPAIATGYSGSLDFMTVGNSYLVDYELVRVGPDTEIYPANGIWAEPSVEHAAELMRRVVEHPTEARAKAERGRRDVTTKLSPQSVGTLMRARLGRLARNESELHVSNGTDRSSAARRLARSAARSLPPGVRERLRRLV